MQNRGFGKRYFYQYGAAGPSSFGQAVTGLLDQFAGSIPIAFDPLLQHRLRYPHAALELQPQALQALVGYTLRSRYAGLRPPCQRCGKPWRVGVPTRYSNGMRQ